MTDEVAGLGARIRARREQWNWTVSELARQSGVSRSYLWQIEVGRSSPTADKLIAIAKALNVQAAYLLGEPALSLDPVPGPPVPGPPEPPRGGWVREGSWF